MGREGLVPLDFSTLDPTQISRLPEPHDIEPVRVQAAFAHREDAERVVKHDASKYIMKESTMGIMFWTPGVQFAVIPANPGVHPRDTLDLPGGFPLSGE